MIAQLVLDDRHTDERMIIAVEVECERVKLNDSRHSNDEATRIGCRLDNAYVRALEGLTSLRAALAPELATKHGAPKARARPRRTTTLTRMEQHKEQHEAGFRAQGRVTFELLCLRLPG